MQVVEEFQKNGFIIFKKAFNSDLCTLLGQEVESIHANFTELKSQFPALHKLGVWSIKNPHIASSQIRNFLFSLPFENICKSIVGSHVDFYWATTATKPAEKGKAFPWHQDVGYEEDPKEYITCWTALDHVDEDNGCLWAIPGSHKWKTLPHEFRKSTDQEYAGVFVNADINFDSKDKVPIRLEPGDTVCMHSNLVHCSFQNLSLKKRRGIISAYTASTDSHLKHVRGYQETTEPFIRNGSSCVQQP